MPTRAGAADSMTTEVAPPAELELAWLLEEHGELFCRFRRRP